MSKWISVEDRLPDDADCGSWVAVVAFCEDGYTRIYDYNIKSNVWKHGLNDIMVRVTYWMPLPGPPE